MPGSSPHSDCIIHVRYELEKRMLVIKEIFPVTGGDASHYIVDCMKKEMCGCIDRINKGLLRSSTLFDRDINSFCYCSSVMSLLAIAMTKCNAPLHKIEEAKKVFYSIRKQYFRRGILGTKSSLTVRSVCEANFLA